MTKQIGRLHVLTDIILQSRFSHVELARSAIAGGADTIQFRQKSGSAREMIEVARQIKHLCADAGVMFIVNDRVDIAIAAGADGIHLGQDDFPIPLARQIMGENSIIGGSAATKEEARKCFSEGADYVGLGPIYPTSSKEDAGMAIGSDLLKDIAYSIPLPIIAIGGIGVKNVSEVIEAGANGIAVISAVCCREDPEQETKALYQALCGADHV
ncbi:MAG: thiamine phosphate synthase [Desulfobacterales bacterium]|nr:thiamine phosphate synthase [Desulfobacterales bacterium]